MNESPDQEKDFNSLIGQMRNLSETRDKSISEINEIIDRIKQNRKPSAEQKEAANLTEPSDVISQFRKLVQKMDVANERLQAISNRLNELA